MGGDLCVRGTSLCHIRLLALTLVNLIFKESNLQRVHLQVKAGSDLEEVELRVVELLDQVIADCR